MHSELEAKARETRRHLAARFGLAGAPSDDNLESQEIIDQLFQPDKDHRARIELLFLLRQIPTELWQLETFSDAHKRLEGIAGPFRPLSLLDVGKYFRSQTNGMKKSTPPSASLPKRILLS